MSPKHYRLTIVGDTLINGVRWAIQREQVFEGDDTGAEDYYSEYWERVRDERVPIRFDPDLGGIVRRGADGPRPVYPCRFDVSTTPPGESGACGAGVQYTRGRGTTGAAEPDRGVVLRFESGATLTYGVGPTVYPDSSGASLVFAQVGGEEYGEAFRSMPYLPDLTPPHLYFPLAVGNEWQYANLGTLPTVAGWYTRRQITRDSVFEGTRYFVEVTTRVNFDRRGWVEPYERVVRFDSTTSRVVELVNGREWTFSPSCPFNTDFRATVRCFDSEDEEYFPDGDTFVSGRPDVQVPFGLGTGAYGLGRPTSTLDVLAVKSFISLGIANVTSYSYYAAPIGYAGEDSGRNLIYARVHLEDGVYEVGARYAVAATDRPAPPAFEVSAGPNPTAGPSRSASTSPPRPTSPSRRSTPSAAACGGTAPLGAGRQTLSLDAGAWAPGLYVVRVTAGGAARTIRVVRR